MEFLNNSKNFSLNRKTYINLRWIGIIGQFITINVVAFIFKFEFNFILANIVVFIGALSNILLFYFFKKNQLQEKISLIFLILDILQLSFLLYLTGGTINPFSIFLIIPSIFAANSLSIKTNILLRPAKIKIQSTNTGKLSSFNSLYGQFLEKSFLLRIDFTSIKTHKIFYYCESITYFLWGIDTIYIFYMGNP